ncbi:MAG: PilZ domain-containing protein [Verrucomicrobiota bacterium]
MSDTIDPTSLRYDSAALEDRCAPRIKIRIPAMLRQSGNTGFTVVVTDLSIAGFQCEALTGMPPGSRCWLALPGLSPIQAELVWNNGRAVGCAFSNILNEAVLDLDPATLCPRLSAFRTAW